MAILLKSRDIPTTLSNHLMNKLRAVCLETSTHLGSKQDMLSTN